MTLDRNLSESQMATLTSMAIWVVELASGGTKLEHTQRKLLNFENWTNGELSKSAKI